METGKEWNLTFIPLGSKIINKTLFFCLSISVINTTIYNRYFSVKMECPEELKCAATGRPGKLSLIE